MESEVIMLASHFKFYPVEETYCIKEKTWSPINSEMGDPSGIIV